jgi:histidinol-phosphate aminotransferase
MPISRRHLLQRLGAAAAAAAAAAPWLAEASSGAELSGGRIRLNRNENPCGPSPRVLATMRDAWQQVAGRDPDVECEALRTRIARFHSVGVEQVVLGCGSTEILRMTADAFAGPAKAVIVGLPTFEMMGGCARRAGAEVVAVPLNRDYSHDLAAMLERTAAAAGLVYICNPNNPTGTLTRRRDIEAFIRELPERVYVLIDEAYHHYVGESSDYASFIDRPTDDARVIVARSFSKIHGLAGLRVGYAIAAAQTARLLAAGQLPGNVNVVAAQAAATALDDQEYVRVSARRNADDRQEFLNQANARMLRPIDSQTNFVLLNTERPAGEVVEQFEKSGVLLAQPFPGFDTHVRISIGSPAEMREFWAIWDLKPVRHGSMN